MKTTNKAYAILMGLPEVQRLHLRLMELASFNNYDGPKVVLSLLKNTDLWEACLMDREAYWTPAAINEVKFPLVTNLIKLRDMGKEACDRLGKQIWNVDTVFILPKPDRRTQSSLEKLVKTWQADEIGWIEWPASGTLLGGGNKGDRILRVWWD